jgi:hypothetical protein
MIDRDRTVASDQGQAGPPLVAPLRILHLEDNPADAVLIRELLEAGGLACDITVAGDRETFEAALHRGPFDLLLSDYSLPQFDGLSALAIARDRLADTPWIFVSGTIGEEAAVEALRHGAVDYVLKDRTARLVPAVRRALHESVLRREAMRARAAAEQLSHRLRDLHELTVGSSVRFEEQVTQALRVGMEWFGLSRAVVARVEGDTWSAQYQFGAALPPGDQAVAGTCSAEVLARDTALVIPGGPAPAARTHPALGSALAAYVGVPVTVASRPYGILELLGTLPPVEAFDERDVASATMLARWLGAQLERRSLEAQLAQAQKLEAVGTLAAGIAHDFNNVLAAIRFTAEALLLEHGSASPAATGLKEIGDTAARAAGLTRQLLTFSRKEVSQPTTLDLGALLERLTPMIDRLVGSQITVQVAERARDATTFADPGQLEQVIMNLCVNARDAMPFGGTITLGTARRTIDRHFAAHHPWAHPGDFAVLSVADTGSGMDAETRARVFEPFFTTKGPGLGTGLGLALVWGIVTQHGGCIDVRSTPGRGTTFDLYLPYEPLLTGAPAAATAPAPQRGAGMVLFVDDEDGLRRVGARVLGRLGYTVIACANGADAVRAAAEHKADLHAAVIDVTLPDVSGFAVMHGIRAHVPEIRIVFASGRPLTPEQLAMAAEAAFLQKPYGIEDLARAVQGAVGAALSEE